MSSTKTTSRLVRWALRLQKFDFVIEYRKGKLNMAPDALSRMHSKPECSHYSTQKEDLEFPINAAIIWEKQHQDTEIAQIFQELAKDDNLLKVQFDVIEEIISQDSPAQWPSKFSSVHPQKLDPHHPTALSFTSLVVMCCHVGIYKTFKRLHHIAFWTGKWTDVKQHV